MRSSFGRPINIGSDEMVSINQLGRMAASIAGKDIRLKHVPGPLGVRGRKSDNRLIASSLGWQPRQPLKAGLEKTYRWIDLQVSLGSQSRGADFIHSGMAAKKKAAAA